MKRLHHLWTVDWAVLVPADIFVIKHSKLKVHLVAFSEALTVSNDLGQVNLECRIFDQRYVFPRSKLTPMLKQTPCQTQVSLVTLLIAYNKK